MLIGPMPFQIPRKTRVLSSHGRGLSNGSKNLTTSGSPVLAPMAALISCWSGEFGGRMLSGSAPVRVLAKQKTSPRILTLSSARKKPTKPSSWKALPRKSKIVPSGSNSSKSTIARPAAAVALFSRVPAVASSASLRKLPSVRMNTRKISRTRSRAGSSNSHCFRELFSRFRRRVPHLLLNLPLPVRLAMQHQGHLAVALDNRFSVGRLYHLMLRRPLRSPIPTYVNILELHRLLPHFIARHLPHNFFHPRRNLLPPNHSCVARHYI